MSVYFVCDENRRIACCESGIDDTSAYIPAILRFFGVTGIPIAPNELSKLNENDVLISVRTKLPFLPCTVISFAPQQDWKEKIEKKWYGTLRFTKDNSRDLPIFAPICSMLGACDQIIATGNMHGDQPAPVIVRIGKEYVFSFDLPASVWYSGDGFEQSGGKNGFKVARVPDMRPVPLDFDTTTLPYNDILLTVIRDILSSVGIPMIHTLPPLDCGMIPDLAMNFSGDDDANSFEVNRTAALHMESRGLPYHINAMPRNSNEFAMSKEEFDFLQDHGCEFGLHTNFYGSPYSIETQKAQLEQFVKIFETAPVTNVDHCLIREGSTAERLEWLEALGIIGSNNMLGEIVLANINAFNLTGFGFGTAFPRYTCASSAQKNRLIETVEMVIGYYEPRIDAEKYPDNNSIRNYIDINAEAGAYAEFFIHPHYLNECFGNQAMVHAALDVIQSHCREKGYKVWYTTTNNIARFWSARINSAIKSAGDGKYLLDACCPLVIQLPDTAESVFANENELQISERSLYGKNVRLATITAPGEYTLRFE